MPSETPPKHGNSLESRMTWPEIVEHITGQLCAILLPSEIPEFKKWLTQRQPVGKLFDSLLIYRCFRIHQDLNRNLDHFIIICGKEGSGKSTLASQTGATLTIDKIHMVWTAKEYLQVIYDRLKHTTDTHDKPCLIMDEGTELLASESWNLTNRSLTKTFLVQRQLSMPVIILIPNFHLLDSIVRMHRVGTLIQIIDRGHYKAFIGKAIKIVAEEGAKIKDVLGVKVPHGTFWYGTFNKDMPPCIQVEQYLKDKRESAARMVGDLLKLMEYDKMVGVSATAHKLGLNEDTIKRMIRDGKLQGKQIGKKWYMPASQAEKLMRFDQIPKEMAV